uniref:Uncharacterized protein LOC117354740 n=1 Tax=Geotrypetes seraphini TaxID=260995 RepID=A0A6P8Q116_GEOSA|nr:uncharacterized protein LOC117354740 [Geotrypetes seraphini]
MMILPRLLFLFQLPGRVRLAGEPSSVGTSLRVWNQTRGGLLLGRRHSWYTPLRHNPAFPPGWGEGVFAIWESRGLVCVGQLWDPVLSRIRPYSELRGRFGFGVRDLFPYLQVVHYIRSSGLLGDLRGGKTPFELLLGPVLWKGALSAIYRCLNCRGTPHSYMLAWEGGWGSAISWDTWEDIWKEVSSVGIAALLIENGYKVIFRWYYTPQVLARWRGGVNVLCWRGCGEVGTYLHMWWHCGRVRGFWTEVFSRVSRILDFQIPDDWRHALLYWHQLDLARGDSLFCKLAFTAARLALASLWNQAHPPTWDMVEHRLLNWQLLYQLTVLRQGKQHGYAHIWRRFRATVGMSGRGGVGF